MTSYSTSTRSNNAYSDIETMINSSSTEPYMDNVAFPCSDEYYYSCPVFIVSTLIFTAGMIGNIVTICVISCSKTLRCSSTFTCIVCLAVSDLWLLLVTYWEEMVGVMFGWPFSEQSKLICTLYVDFSFSPYFLSCFLVSMLAFIRFKYTTKPLTMSLLQKPKFVLSIFILVLLTLLSAMGVFAYFTHGSSCANTLYENNYIVFLTLPTAIGTIIFLLSLHFRKVHSLRRSLSIQSRPVQKSLRNINIVINVVIIIYVSSQVIFIMFDVVAFIEMFFRPMLSEEIKNNIISVGLILFLLNHALNPYIYFISFLLKSMSWNRKCTVRNVHVISSAENRTKIKGIKRKINK